MLRPPALGTMERQRSLRKGVAGGPGGQAPAGRRDSGSGPVHLVVDRGGPPEAEAAGVVCGGRVGAGATLGPADPLYSIAAAAPPPPLGPAVL